MVPLTPSWPTAKEGECGDRSSGVSDLIDGPESDPSLPNIRGAFELRRQLS